MAQRRRQVVDFLQASGSVHSRHCSVLQGSVQRTSLAVRRLALAAVAAQQPPGGGGPVFCGRHRPRPWWRPHPRPRPAAPACCCCTVAPPRSAHFTRVAAVATRTAHATAPAQCPAQPAPSLHSLFAVLGPRGARFGRCAAAAAQHAAPPGRRRLAGRFRPDAPADREQGGAGWGGVGWLAANPINNRALVGDC